ncbi:MAG: hypothetical protein M3407_00995 [Acidobacteriota bacterium]|nr:hypothetical protein [Acidobacteriota bacterium]
MVARVCKEFVVLQENLKKITELWKREELKLAKPLLESEIIDTFANLRIPISKEVIDVYSNLGGMIDWGTDSICFSLWTVEKIVEENGLNLDLTFFADFLINSHLYGFKFENEDISSIHIYHGANDMKKSPIRSMNFLKTI